MESRESAFGFPVFDPGTAAYLGALPGTTGQLPYPAAGASAMDWAQVGPTGQIGMPDQMGQMGYVGPMGVAGPMGQMMPMAPMAAAPSMAQYWGLQLARALWQTEAAMPAQEVLRSLMAETMVEPALRDLPAMQRANETGRTHLSDLAAIGGLMRRILAGDTAPAVLSALQQQLRAAQQSGAECRAAVSQLAAAETARESEAIRTIALVSTIADQVSRTALAAMQPIATGVPGTMAGRTPLSVGLEP